VLERPLSCADRRKAALKDLVDRRVADALADRENGSHPTWLSIEEPAEYLRVSPSTIGRMLRNDRLRSTYIGRRRLVRREDLDL
jgi:excisionase family DNA binding protein